MQEAEFELSSTERRVLESVAGGVEADLRPDPDETTDPSTGGEWGDDQTIRGRFLQLLLGATPPDWTVHFARVRIRGARISGHFDLGATSLSRTMILRDCHFDERLSLWGAVAPAIYLVHCHIPGVDASELTTRGSLVLRACLVEGAGVDLQGAQIGLDLDCTAGKFRHPGGVAFTADGATVSGRVFLGGGFISEGEVTLLGIEIGGDLSCTGGAFKNPEGNALVASGAAVRGGVFMSHGFVAEGGVRLVGARIGSNLQCIAGAFKNPRGDALVADRTTIAGEVFMNDGFVAEGAVRLPGAEIGGGLNCRAGAFRHPKGDALVADRTAVAEVFMNDGFVAEGGVRLLGARIRNNLRCTAGAFKNPEGDALVADGATVDGDTFLDDGFVAEGRVRLFGAEIKGILRCTGGTFNGSGREALFAQGMRVGWAFVWKPADKAKGLIDLTDARVGHFVDEKTSWPPAGSIDLDGFVYDSISAEPEVSEEDRLTWLRLTTYAPQPYEQLAHACRRRGDEGAARRVLLAKERVRREQGGLNWSMRAWSRFLDLSVGYGYKPRRALTLLAAVWLAGIVLLTWGPARGGAMMSLSSGQNVPAFERFIYPIDLVLPIVNFGQREFWFPDISKPWGWLYMVYTRFAITAGWLLTTALVAGVTRVLRRE